MANLSIRKIFIIALVLSSGIPFVFYTLNASKLAGLNDSESNLKSKELLNSEKNLLKLKINEIELISELLTTNSFIIDYINLPDELKEFTSPKLNYIFREINEKYALNANWTLRKNGRAIYTSGKKDLKQQLKITKPIAVDDQGLQSESSIKLGDLILEIDKRIILNDFTELTDFELNNNSVLTYQVKNKTKKPRSLYLPLQFTILIMCLVVSFLMLKKLILDPIIIRTNMLKEIIPSTNINKNKNELEVLGNYYKEFISLTNKKVENDSKLKISKQLAHDIRSPLAALDVSIKSLDLIAPSQKQLIRSAINRIHDIANSLVGKDTRLAPKNETESTLLSSVISEIVSEKRIEFRNLNHIEIDFLFNSNSYGIFSQINNSEFKRIISNIINNSIEAIEKENAYIEVKLSSLKDFNIITIKDNGKGIKEENIAEIFLEGKSFDKNDGTGLGLFHALSTLKKWSASIECNSIRDDSTTFTITLPKSDPIDTFVPEIIFRRESRIIIIDDDISIHNIWRGRLKSAGLRSSQVTYYSQPSAFLKGNPLALSKHDVLLVDYEFIGSDMTGLELGLKIAHTNFYLITSRYDESHIKNTCKVSKIALIDKGMIGFIPITISEEGEHIVLIDDDDLIHMSWQQEANLKKLNLKSYKTVDDFLNDELNFPKDTTIYIDSNLANNIKGEVESKRIFDLGFKKIILTTGYSKEDINKPDWIKEIVGKRANFS